MIFEVDEEKFLLLRSASYLSGTFEIIPVPRNANYTAKEGETLISGEFFTQQIKMKSNMLTPDINTDVKDDENSLSNNSVIFINEDLKGNILIGTGYGLNILDVKKDTFKRYTEKDG